MEGADGRRCGRPELDQPLRRDARRQDLRVQLPARAVLSPARRRDEVSLAAGTKLGPYEILAPIGAGGMGEVYRAKDTKLKRDVALKLLPEAFAADPERMAPFQ